MLRVAAAQYPLSRLNDWDEYQAKIHSWVKEASCQGANLLLFPEYFSVELACLSGHNERRSLKDQLNDMQLYRADFLSLFRCLAAQYRVYVCAGTFPVPASETKFFNRSDFFAPDGHVSFQDKLQMTRFERETWQIRGGKKIRTFPMEFGNIGISICYDSEFPLLVRRQVELGATVILTPSCTDNLSGYYRVRIACQARALENQCYVVQASMVGKNDCSEAVDVGIGAAGVYSPVDQGFPDDGILAMGNLNAAQWVFADLDMSAIELIRSEGQVLNHRDWDDQFIHLKS